MFSYHIKRSSTILTSGISGCDAAGSVRALGARCRRFKSCYPDQILSRRLTMAMVETPMSSRRGRANPARKAASCLCGGLTQGALTRLGGVMLPRGTHTNALPRRVYLAEESICSGGGIGRRNGLKIRYRKRCVGSSPTRSTSAHVSA